jgi:hypothetical protein
MFSVTIVAGDRLRKSHDWRWCSHLVGGFKHFLFSIVIIRDVILPIDFHMFQDVYCNTNQWW